MIETTINEAVSQPTLNEILRTAPNICIKPTETNHRRMRNNLLSSDDICFTGMLSKEELYGALERKENLFYSDFFCLCIFARFYFLAIYFIFRIFCSWFSSHFLLIIFFLAIFSPVFFCLVFFCTRFYVAFTNCCACGFSLQLLILAPYIFHPMRIYFSCNICWDS